MPFPGQPRTPPWLLGRGGEAVRFPAWGGHFLGLASSTPWPAISLGDCGDHLLVVLGGHVKAPQEDVGVPQVAVGPPLGCLVSKLLSNGQALRRHTGGQVVMARPRGLTWADRGCLPAQVAGQRSVCPGEQLAAAGPSADEARTRWGAPAARPYHPALSGTTKRVAQPCPCSSPAPPPCHPARLTSLWKVVASVKFPNK